MQENVKCNAVSFKTDLILKLLESNDGARGAGFEATTILTSLSHKSATTCQID